MKDSLCPMCGGTIRPTKKPGRRWVLIRGIDSEIPESIAVPTCDRCGDEYTSPALTKVIDKAVRAELAKKEI